MNFTRLETKHLAIRPFTSVDTKTIYLLSREKSLGEWIPDQVYEDENEAAEVIDFLISQYSPSPNPKERPFVLAIELKNSGEVIGHVGLSALTEGEVEIGYAIAEAHVGRGYASEAVAAVSQWALFHLDLPSIHGITARENFGSGKVLEKTGYKLESESDHFYLGKIRPCRRYLLSKANL